MRSEFTDWLSYLCLGAAITLLIAVSCAQLSDYVADKLTEDEICELYPEWMECA